jgi:hypothetical protein
MDNYFGKKREAFVRVDYYQHHFSFLYCFHRFLVSGSCCAVLHCHFHQFTSANRSSTLDGSVYHFQAYGAGSCLRSLDRLPGGLPDARCWVMLTQVLPLLILVVVVAKTCGRTLWSWSLRLKHWLGCAYATRRVTSPSIFRACWPGIRTLNQYTRPYICFDLIQTWTQSYIV